MKRARTTMLAVLVLCAAASLAFARNTWHWTVPHLVADTDSPPQGEDPGVFFYLSSLNGAHSAAMTQYNHGGSQKVWTSILACRYVEEYDPGGSIRAYEYDSIGSDWQQWHKAPVWPSHPNDPTNYKYRAYNCHVTLNSQEKIATWGNKVGSSLDGRADGDDLTDQGGVFWSDAEMLNAGWDCLTPDTAVGVAVALFQSPLGNEAKGCAVFSVRDPEGPGDVDNALYGQYTSDGGNSWVNVVGPDSEYVSEIATWDDDDTVYSHPSLATDNRRRNRGK